MKISTVLTVGMLVIGGVAFTQTALSSVKAVQNYRSVEMLSRLADLRNSWIKGIVALSLERSITQLMLTQDTAAQVNFAPLRQEQRAKADEFFAKFQADLLGAGDFPNRDAMLAEAESVAKTMGKLRDRFERLLKLPLENRDPKAIHVAISQFMSTVTKLELKSDLLSIDNDQFSTEALNLLVLQENSWIISEYAGRARTHYAIATFDQKPLGPADRARSASDLLRANDAWNAIEQLVNHPSARSGFTAEMLEQVDTLRTQGLDVFEDLTKKIDGQMDEIDQITAELAGSGGSIQDLDLKLDVISFEDYFQGSNVALQKATEMAEKATDDLSAYWQARSSTQLNTLIINLTALVLMISASLFTARIVNRKVTARLGKSLTELSELSAGNLDLVISRTKTDLSEMALLSDGLENLRDKLRIAATAAEAMVESERSQKFVVNRLSEGLRELASGNLSGQISEDFGEKYQTLADDFNSAMTALSDLVARVIETSGTILAGSSGINEATIELSKRTETQGATLQSAAAALEQLTRNIVSSQTDAQELNSLASLANEKSIAMNVTMEHTVAAIEKIKESSHQIGQIVDLIEDIAFQTSLLALNAGVEATRAGNEGSGFAVIASEVRGLAERSATSAQEIKTLIATSVVEVMRGVENVAEAETSVSEIGSYISTISTVISRIAVAADEQSQGLLKVNDGVSRLDLVTQTNVAMVEETTAECEALAVVAQDLTQLVAHFSTSPKAGLPNAQDRISAA